MTKLLDSKDWKILYHLCQDSRISHSRIGRLVRLSKNSVTYRIERLINKGIISGFFTITNYSLLGLNAYTILLRLNAAPEREKDMIGYLRSHPNVTVVDRFVGEWNLLIELGCRTINEFSNFLSEFRSKFSDIIDIYETHTSLQFYKVEQLPVELVEEKQMPKPSSPKPANIDNTDLKLLHELSKNSAAPLYELAEKLGITYETVSARIKKLRESGVVIRFTAKIKLGALGYDVYMIMLDLRNVSREGESGLRNFINAQKNIRYAFMSAQRPTILLYIAVKTSSELNSFLVRIKEKFSSIIVSQKYLLSTEQIKYDLFPEGFVV